jgi:hypothetical protein
MKSIIINAGYGDPFCVSHKAFLRLRDLGQTDALNEVDKGAYWPKAAAPNEPSLNQCGRLVPRDDAKLVQRGGPVCLDRMSPSLSGSLAVF